MRLSIVPSILSVFGSGKYFIQNRIARIGPGHVYLDIADDMGTLFSTIRGRDPHLGGRHASRKF